MDLHPTGIAQATDEKKHQEDSGYLSFNPYLQYGHRNVRCLTKINPGTPPMEYNVRWRTKSSCPIGNQEF